MRIVFFATRFAFEYSIELANHMLLKEQVKEVFLFLPNGFVSEVQLGQLSKDVHFFPFELPGNKKFLASYRSFSKVARKIKEIQPDVIHVQGSAHPYFWLFHNRFKRIPIVDTIHDAEPHPGFENFFQSFMRRKGIKNARKWFIHGQSLKELYASLHPSISKKDIMVIPKGHYRIFMNYANGNQKEETETILFFGNITKYKGIHVLLEASKKVISAFPEVKFVIAGKIREKDADAIDVSHLKDNKNFELMTYRVSEAEVAALYKRATMIVLPYIEASQSGVLSIALGVGKPIIATRVGALPELIEDHVNGILIEPNESEELADAMIELLSDPELRGELAKNAYNYADRELSWSVVADKTLEVYTELIN